MENKNYIALMILCGSLVCFGCSQDTVQFEWRQLESGTGEHLYGVHFIDTKHGWAVGTDGTVLSTVNGGASWKATSISKDTLTQVNFANAKQRMDRQHWAGALYGQWGCFVELANIKPAAWVRPLRASWIFILLIQCMAGQLVEKGQCSKQRMAGVVGKVKEICRLNIYRGCVFCRSSTRMDCRGGG